MPLALLLLLAAAPPEPLTLLDSAGVVRTLGDPDARATAVVFLSRECPISRSYLPELTALAARRAAQGVQLYGVISEPEATAQDVAEYARTYQLGFPLLFDGSGALAARFAPRATPEVLVLDRALAVRYRGRIDDGYADLGKPRTQRTTHELEDALDAVLANKPPPADTEPVGCLVEPPSQADGGSVTWAREVAPILYANCVVCHRPGEVAPFPLLSFSDAASRAHTLAKVVEKRSMPPWKPEPGFAHFRGERRLSEAQIALIKSWAEAGAPQGDPKDAPVAPSFPGGWSLGEPDLVISMPEAYPVPAGGPDVYRSFVMPTHLPRDAMISAVEFRPGTPSIVHHSLLYLDSTGAARKLDAAAPGPGFTNFGGPGFRGAVGLGAWGPGSMPQVLPEGMAYPLPRNADVIFQMHYHPSGKPERDRSSLGIYLAKKPVKQVVGNVLLVRFDIDIPAGKADYTRTIKVTLPEATTVVGVVPHMHLLGKQVKATATLPSGKVVPLLWIPDWDFRWQTYYTYREPLRLPAGTRVEIKATFDNSSENPFNPSDPPKRVRYGEQTTDEMFFCPLQVAAPNAEALRALQDALITQELRQ